MNMPDRVLELLFDREEGFFSLDELAAAAKLSRSDLDRCICELRSRGHEIEFSPAHGLRLARPVHLSAHLIERGLDVRRVGRGVIVVDEVGSTNDVALDSARGADADGLVVAAEFQRRGRGRHGRAWLSPSRANLTFSVVLLDSDPQRLAHEALTIAAGLAVAEGIAAAAGCDCELKWPNDVLLDGAKVAGVLVELKQPTSAANPSRASGSNDRRCLIVGIGINVNAAPAPDELETPATCLADHLGCAVERIEVLREVLRRLDKWVAKIASGRLDALHEAWLARCGMVNRRITVVSAGRQCVGRVLDVSPLEGLILSTDDGQQVHLSAESSTVLAF